MHDQDGLRVHNLHMWRGERQILDGVGFVAAPGQLVQIAGSNGAGKTTLLRILSGLTLAEEGEVCWRGRSVSRDRAAYHAEVAFLGHRDGICDDMSTTENLRYGLELMGAHAADMAVTDVLKRMRLDQHAELPARALSAGQRRRTALARIFLSGARLWLLDEPYTHLDSQGKGLLNLHISRKLDADGVVVLTTHDPLMLPRPAAVEVEL